MRKQQKFYIPNYIGSSNSQDSFPAGGSSNPPLDGYGNYQSSYTAGTPGTSSEYTPPPPRPPSQSSAPPHQGISVDKEGGRQKAEKDFISLMRSIDTWSLPYRQYQ